jgi:ribosomal protein S2
MKKQKREEIKITFVGTKKFKQGLVDKICELLQSEEFMEDAAKPGCGLTFTSTLEPSEDLLN